MTQVPMARAITMSTAVRRKARFSGSVFFARYLDRPTTILLIRPPQLAASFPQLEIRIVPPWRVVSALSCVLSGIASVPIHESFAERKTNWMDLCPQEAPSSDITALHSGSHR
jgi:hypothetical protein